MVSGNSDFSVRFKLTCEFHLFGCFRFVYCSVITEHLNFFFLVVWTERKEGKTAAEIYQGKKVVMFVPFWISEHQ